MAVVPNRRGRGIGKALLAALIKQAQAWGHQAISLSVEDGNRARLLYERAGFKAEGGNGGSDTTRLQLSR